MVKLVGAFGRLENSRILVVGDLMLDTYTVGKASRISPEAPVAVVHVHHEEHRPGGAGNVVLNLLALGMDVSVIGRVGNDTAGRTLVQALQEVHVDCVGIQIQDNHPTPVKNRVISDNQQIVRVDREQCTPLDSPLEERLCQQIPQLLEQVKVVAISDYGKGLLTPRLLQTLIGEAQERCIPVITDPKGIDFAKYSGSTVIKPNFSEAIAASGLERDTPLPQIAERLLQITHSQALMITRSQDGISVYYPNRQIEHYPVQIREIKDVTGAGDTVLAMICCGLASGLELSSCCQLANVAAGIAIERFGCARVSLSDLARRLLEGDLANKVFDEEHLFALCEALKGQKVAVLGLHGAAGLHPQAFAALRKLHQRPQWATLAYVRDIEPDEHFIEMLVSLREVDFIILKSESLRHLCAVLSPDEVYVVEQGELQQLQRMGDLVTA